MCARHPLEIYGATAQRAPGKAFQLPHPSLKQKQCARSSDEDFNIYIYQALKTGSCTFFSEQSTFIEQSVDKAQLGALCPGIDCWGGQGAGTQTVPSAACLAPLGYTEPSLQFNISLNDPSDVLEKLPINRQLVHVTHSSRESAVRRASPCSVTHTPSSLNDRFWPWQRDFSSNSRMHFCVPI